MIVSDDAKAGTAQIDFVAETLRWKDENGQARLEDLNPYDLLPNDKDTFIRAIAANTRLRNVAPFEGPPRPPPKPKITSIV